MCQVSCICVHASLSYLHPIVDFANLPSSSEKAVKRPPTSIFDISASSERTASSFGQDIRLVFLLMTSEIQVARPPRSPFVGRGFAPCWRLETEYRVSTSTSHNSASRAPRELRFREDVPSVILCTRAKAHPIPPRRSRVIS